jgi:diacylglycerol kinase family enzyme
MDGQHSVRRRIRSVMVGNCGKLMGGVEIFPGAKVDDGILDVVVLAPVGRLGWLGVLAGVFGRNKDENESVEYFTGKTAEVELAHEQDFQLDGDPLGKATHLKVTVEPGALALRMASA